MKTALFVRVAPLSWLSMVFFGGIASPINARDPFWPIGYEPAVAVVVETKAQPVVKVKPAMPKEITSEEWAAARKALPITGYMKSARSGFENTYMAMINRKLTSIGDTVKFPHDGITFFWRAESIVNGDVVLVQIKAERE